MSLQLCDLLRLAGIDLGGFKIHLATGWPNPPLIAHFDGKFKEWQEYQNRRNFECDNWLQRELDGCYAIKSENASSCDRMVIIAVVQHSPRYSY